MHVYNYLHYVVNHQKMTFVFTGSVSYLIYMFIFLHKYDFCSGRKCQIQTMGLLLYFMLHDVFARYPSDARQKIASFIYA